MSYHVAPAPFATFYSLQTQTIANKGNAQAITYNITGAQKGITLVDSTKITLPQVGNYCLTFSAIGLDSASNSGNNLSIWLRKNGSDVDNSNTIVLVKKSSPTTVVATVDITCTAVGQYYELYMAGQDTTVQLAATPAQVAVPGVSPAQPACPSVIVAIWQIN